jgi:hypothetical protein
MQQYLKIIALSFMVIDPEANANSTFAMHAGKMLAKHG